MHFILTVCQFNSHVCPMLLAACNMLLVWLHSLLNADPGGSMQCTSLPLHLTAKSEEASTTLWTVVDCLTMESLSLPHYKNVSEGVQTSCSSCCLRPRNLVGTALQWIFPEWKKRTWSLSEKQKTRIAGWQLSGGAERNKGVSFSAGEPPWTPVSLLMTCSFWLCCIWQWLLIPRH